MPRSGARARRRAVRPASFRSSRVGRRGSWRWRTSSRSTPTRTTTIFDGKDELFCPLSIGEVEQRLDGSRFVRVHRSHIVNLQRITGLRRAGDNGIIELAGNKAYTVPVSRNRLSWLKAQLGLKTTQAAL